MADWNCCLDEDIPDELPDIGGEPDVSSVLLDHPSSAQENSLEVVKPREIVRKQKVRGPQSKELTKEPPELVQLFRL